VKVALGCLFSTAVALPIMLAGLAVAQSGGLRSRVDIEQPPWRAVGKLQAVAGSHRTTCTAVLVAPRTALTAAHCLFNVRTQRAFLPSSLHVLIGFAGQTFAAAASVVSFVTGPGFDYNEPARTRSSDWAILTLPVELGTPDRVLPIASRLPAAGAALMVGGYGQDNPNVLTADLDCRVLGLMGARHRGLIRHDCAAVEGVSGAPLLVRSGEGWSVAGLNVAKSKTGTAGLAVALDSERWRQWLQ
jgi:protease YdgD